MGNACCHFQQGGGAHHINKHVLHGVAGNRVVNRRSASSVSPSGNTRSGNPGLPLDQDVSHPQMTQDGNVTTPSKVQNVYTEGQQVASTDAAANQADGSDILKGDNVKDTSVDCKKNDLFLIPECDNDEDVCPTCLDGYDEENPKIVTKCNHHYHLSCILEWKERSENCPVCDKVMAFEESSLV